MRIGTARLSYLTLTYVLTVINYILTVINRQLSYPVVFIIPLCAGATTS